MVISELDQEKIEQLAGNVFGHLNGTMVIAMIWLGERLGFYKAMRGAGPMSTQTLAEKMGLSERWVREWVHGQVAAGYINYDGNSQFELTNEAAAVLADEMNPAFSIGGIHHIPKLLGDILFRIPECFRTGMGLTYDELGAEAAIGVEGFFAPWFRNSLVPVALPALTGVVEKLVAGARVADIGCGTGLALLELAKAYPKSEYHGYELSQHALKRANENLQNTGLKNVSFHNVRDEQLPADSSHDFILTFDCIHDMAHPTEAINAIRKAIKPDGTWFIADIHCGADLNENLKIDNPWLPMLYGFSVLSCMSSSLSEPGGEGLGAVGFSSAVAERMTAEAGFTQFRSLDFEHPLNDYYEVRP